MLKTPFLNIANNLNENKITTTFESVNELNGELNIWEHKNDLGQNIKTTTNT